MPGRPHLERAVLPADQLYWHHHAWTHWDLNPGPSACEADVMPLHHVPWTGMHTTRHGPTACLCVWSMHAYGLGGPMGGGGMVRDAAMRASYETKHAVMGRRSCSIDPGRTRTCNPRLRRPMPYPLGHGATCRLNLAGVHWEYELLAQPRLRCALRGHHTTFSGASKCTGAQVKDKHTRSR